MDAYKIGVSIALQNNVSAGLAIIGRDLLKLNSTVKDVERSFGKWATAIGGVAGVLVGSGLITGLAKVAEHGTALLDQQDKLRRAGVSMNEVLRIQKEYYDKIATAVPTSTAAEYLKTFNELRSVLGAAQAEAVAPWSMKVEAIIANATGKSAEGEGFKLWRAIEMTGRSMSDPAGSQKLADAFVRDIIGAGGKLDAGTYQTMAKRGGVAWANAKPEFLAGPMSVVAADLGGDTAGTALMSAYMFLTGANTMSKQQYAVLKKAGLIDPSKVTTDKGGRINVGPGGIVGSKEYTGAGKFDLYGWVHDVLAPHLQQLSGGDRATFDSLIAKLGRNRNVMRMLNMFSDPSFIEQITKDLEQWAQASGVDKAYSDAVGGNPKFSQEAFWKQYESMMQAIGAPLMQAAIPVMQSVTSMFTRFGEFANANPEKIKMIGEAIAAVGVALVAAGGIALVSLIGLPAAIGGAVIALAGLAALNWDRITSGIRGLDAAFADFNRRVSDGGWDAAFKTMNDRITAFFKAPPDIVDQWFASWKRAGAELSGVVTGIASKFSAEIATLPSQVAGAISAAIAGIGAAISSGLTSAAKNFLHGNAPIGDPGGGVSPIPQNYRGEGPERPTITKANFIPPPKSQAQIHFTSALNIDGQSLAQVLASKLADLYENSAVSPAANGVAMLDINGGFTAS
jgi:hypothetical protein